MQVILIEPVHNLGNVGETVKVKNGYGRNFLIPQKKALRATKENVAYFETIKADIEKANEVKTKEANVIAKKVNESFAVVIRQAGEDGRLFGSVSARDISQAFAAEKLEVDRKYVVLNRPIKYIGIYTLTLLLHGEVKAKIFVNVARSNDEAKEAEARFKRGETVMEGPEGEEAQTAAKEAASYAEANAAEAPAEEATAAPAEGEASAEDAPKKKKAKAKKAAKTESEAEEA